MVKEELINFETKIGDAFNNGEIKASSNFMIWVIVLSEDSLIKILQPAFKEMQNNLQDLLSPLQLVLEKN